MILRPLGSSQDIDLTFCPGNATKFSVIAKYSGTRLLVDKNRPEEPGHQWGNPIIELDASVYELKFIAFFDWYQFAPRDFAMLEVLIERMDHRPELVGRHGLIEVANCALERAKIATAQKFAGCRNIGGRQP